jgi:hypothetical protein
LYLYLFELKKAAQIKLTDDQKKLWSNDLNDKELNDIILNDHFYDDKNHEEVKKEYCKLEIGSRAHLTLYFNKKYKSNQAGLDLINLLLKQKMCQILNTKYKVIKTSVYELNYFKFDKINSKTDVSCIMTLMEPIIINTVFNSFFF